MKTVVEVIAYTYRAGVHFTGIKLIAGRELQANDVLRADDMGGRWNVKGLGTISAAAHAPGIRPITLVPENDVERLVEGSLLTIEE